MPAVCGGGEGASPSVVSWIGATVACPMVVQAMLAEPLVPLPAPVTASGSARGQRINRSNSEHQHPSSIFTGPFRTDSSSTRSFGRHDGSPLLNLLSGVAIQNRPSMLPGQLLRITEVSSWEVQDPPEE